MEPNALGRAPLQSQREATPDERDAVIAGAWREDLYAYEDVRLLAWYPALDALVTPAALEKDGKVRIADIGCGDGHTARHFAAVFPNATVVGIDSNRALLGHAQAFADDRTSFVHGDARNLSSVGSGSADVALLMSILNHMSDAEVVLVLTEAKRIVGDGGTVIVTCGRYPDEGAPPDSVAEIREAMEVSSYPRVTEYQFHRTIGLCSKLFALAGLQLAVNPVVFPATEAVRRQFGDHLVGHECGMFLVGTVQLNADEIDLGTEAFASPR